MDSNHRPAVYETAALPLSYAGIKAKYNIYTIAYEVCYSSYVKGSNRFDTAKGQCYDFYLVAIFN